MERIEIVKLRSKLWREDKEKHSQLIKKLDTFLDSYSQHKGVINKELMQEITIVQPIAYELMVKQWQTVSRAIKKSDYQHPLIKVIEEEIRGVRLKTKKIIIYLNQGQINTVEEYLS